MTGKHHVNSFDRISQCNVLINVSCQPWINFRIRLHGCGVTLVSQQYNQVNIIAKLGDRSSHCFSGIGHIQFINVFACNRSAGCILSQNSDNIRAMERAERVHGAMCARGWDGRVRTLD